MESSSPKTALRLSRYDITKFYGYSPVYMVTITKIGGSRIVSGVFYTRKLDFFVSALFVRKSRLPCALRSNVPELARDVLQIKKLN
mgnify:CR=1 FL=1